MQLQSSEVTVCFYGTSLINGTQWRKSFLRGRAAPVDLALHQKSALCVIPAVVRPLVRLRVFCITLVVSSNYVIGSAAESRLRAHPIPLMWCRWNFRTLAVFFLSTLVFHSATNTPHFLWLCRRQSDAQQKSFYLELNGISLCAFFNLTATFSQREVCKEPKGNSHFTGCISLRLLL
jgi:hypothetical protein